MPITRVSKVNNKEKLLSKWTTEYHIVHTYDLSEWNERCPFYRNYYAILMPSDLQVRVTKSRASWLTEIEKLLEENPDRKDFMAFKVEKNCLFRKKTKIYIS